MGKHERFDVVLAAQSNISRESAKSLIKSGMALINGKPVTKPGHSVSSQDVLFITEAMKYVSRGGYKLEKALSYFGISLTGKICIDIGASTGGFTDCMLKHGAKKVYAIDVGHNQLAETLVRDERVESYEKMNIRDIPKGFISETVSFAAVDISFISIRKIFGTLYDLFTEEAVCLVKPQFEAGRNVNVSNVAVHKSVLRSIVDEAISYKFGIMGLIVSPIKGSSGNIEYLLHISKMQYYEKINISDIVKKAFGKAEGN